MPILARLLQLFEQDPQVIAEFKRSASQPLRIIPSQLLYPETHALDWKAQPEVVHSTWVGVTCGSARQSEVQEAQCSKSVRRFASQPFESKPSQSP